MEAVKKVIAFTGGGSSGHVTPTFPIIRKAQEAKWDVVYFGSTDLEQELLARKSIKFIRIPAGKLSRFFTLRNALTPIRVIGGIFLAFVHLSKINPCVVFSKGGFVSVPVVIAAWLQKIPVIAHESDFSPGLANKLALPFVKVLCTTFKETAIPQRFKKKVVVTGSPIREEILEGNAERAKAEFKLNGAKETILIFGGSLGARKINEVVFESIGSLVQQFNVVHVCGKGNMRPALSERFPEYVQREYVHNFGDLLHAADFVVSRAGLNSILELVTLRKPHLLIPLSREASRGDQIENATYFQGLGCSQCLPEEELDGPRFIKAFETLRDRRHELVAQMMKFSSGGSDDAIWDVVVTHAGGCRV